MSQLHIPADATAEQIADELAKQGRTALVVIYGNDGQPWINIAGVESNKHLHDISLETALRLADLAASAMSDTPPLPAERGVAQ